MKEFKDTDVSEKDINISEKDISQKDISGKDMRNVVRNSYKNIVVGNNNKDTCCCGSGNTVENSNKAQTVSKSIGYSAEDMNLVPENANLGLGCGNPQIAANIQEGETVLDLGSGAGFDCFLASKKVGRRGLVIGVDMTPEMLTQARKNAKLHRYRNVDFRLGEIENLPVADNTVDVIISNCVINLSTNKQRVYNEAYRVLKVGGRVCISDVVRMKELTDEMKQDDSLYCN
ncbi:Methyltransferase domain-containing protein [Hathewaya proteolytica DSM 3090]|uniref:Arsenite methyltransferase n=1 Tax=Hathewaya proteolytica DSM 3090 TaxID=1121331 RepID=A0A1M6MTG6_9CLOT|nr:Methyltransferase domain-containing protein [Hathewaya proteolytica DSM 3090]